MHFQNALIFLSRKHFWREIQTYFKTAVGISGKIQVFSKGLARKFKILIFQEFWPPQRLRATLPSVATGTRPSPGQPASTRPRLNTTRGTTLRTPP